MLLRENIYLATFVENFGRSAAQWVRLDDGLAPLLSQDFFDVILHLSFCRCSFGQVL